MTQKKFIEDLYSSWNITKGRDTPARLNLFEIDEKVELLVLLVLEELVLLVLVLLVLLLLQEVRFVRTEDGLDTIRRESKGIMLKSNENENE